MKITIIGPSYPYRGGIALFSNRLAEALISEGHEVNIITFKLQYPSFLFPGKTQFSSDKKNNNLNITREINSVNPFNWIKVGKQIKKQQPDLVIFKYWMPFMAPCFGTIAKYIKKNNKTKILALVHNLIPHEKRMGDTLLTKYFLKSIDGFVVMSNSVLADLEQFDTIKPKVFSPHPLYDNFGRSKSREEALKALGLDASHRYMLFFGLIRKYKGLDLLLKAFADKNLNDGSIKLIVAGEFYEDDTEYLNIIKENNLENSIIITNKFIPDEEVVNYFCAADIIVQPYRNATQSGVTQIAYHFDKPMLVTNVGGLKEIVPHNKVGYVVQPNENEVAKALIDFYQNNRAIEFIEGVKEEKKKYSWTKMVETIIMLSKKI
jgi:glycosyltransferase involved in cell wall biosynthesis